MTTYSLDQILCPSDSCDSLMRLRRWRIKASNTGTPAVIVLLVALALLAGPEAACQSNGPVNAPGSKHTRFPGSRRTLQGDAWLRLEYPVRLWFIETAIASFNLGFEDGCRFPQQRADSRAGTDSCRDNKMRPEDTIPLVDQVTKYYKSYPMDRDLPISYLVQMLIGSSPKTFEQIHEWVNGANHRH